MLRVANILTPVDPATSNPALAQALFWGRHLHATVHAVEVQVTEGDALPAAPHVEASPQVQHLVDAQAPPFAGASDEAVQVRAMTMQAPAVVSGLLHYADEHAIDMTVAAAPADAPAHSGLPPHVLMDMAHRTAQPLLVIRGASPEAGPFRRLLTPIDFSRHAQRSLSHARPIAELYSAPLDILHVLERPPYVALNATDMLALSDASLPERRALRRAKALFDQTADGPVDAHFYVEHGDPARQITAFAQAHNNDLVILSSHGSTGQSQHPLGTVTDKLVRRLETSFLLIKSFGTSLVAPTTDARTSAS